MKNKNIKPCPCGRPIDELCISDAGQGGKWAYVTGNCCGEWAIEFRTSYTKWNSTECMELAITAWNNAPRQTNEDLDQAYMHGKTEGLKGARKESSISPACSISEARAMALYSPPFKFQHGFIFDANGEMVSDGELENQDAIQRVRGWGRIGYMDDAEKLQDLVGDVIAKALTEYWQKSAGN